MNISSVNPGVVASTDTLTSTQTREQSSERAKLVQAVKSINDSNTLPDDHELTFVMDRTSHRMLMRIIDRQTQKVVMQIPSEEVLRLAEQVKQSSFA